jgi:hypothetical protein
MDDFALGVCGARSERGWLVEVRAPSRGGYPPGDARLDRVRRYQRAMAALGQYERIAINFFVFNTPQRGKNNLQDFAALRGLSANKAKALLIEALDKLVEFYLPNGAEFDAEDPFAVAA